MNIILIVIHTLLLAGIGFSIARRAGSWRGLVVAALLLKIVAGIALGLLYSRYYDGGDTFVYFDDAARFAAIAKSDFWTYLRILWSGEGLPGTVVFGADEPRALFLVKIASVFHLLTDGNYWLISCYFSVVSFLGAWYLVRRIHEVIPALSGAAVIAFFFFPSVVFWSAGLIKESLVMAGLFFLTGVFLRYWFARVAAVSELLLAIVALWVIWKLKYYYAAGFVPVCFACLLFRLVDEHVRQFRRRVPALVLWLTFLAAPAALMTFLHPNFSPTRFLVVISENNEAFTALSAPQDMIHFDDVDATLASVLSNAPLALVSGLFRPGVWEAHNVLQWLAAAENLLLLLITLAAVGDWKAIKSSKSRVLLLAALVYVAALCVFVTISTPNFGTLSRYRIGYLPFYLFLVLCNKLTLTCIQRFLNNLVLYRR